VISDSWRPPCISEAEAVSRLFHPQLLHQYSVVTILANSVFSILLGLMLRPLLIDEIETLRLDFPVDKGTSKSSNDFLGLGMAIGLAMFCYMILVCLCSLVGGSARDELVADMSLMRGG